MVGLIESIWLVTLAMAIQIGTGLDVLAKQPIAIIVLVLIGICIIHRLCLTSNKASASFEEAFHGWPKHKRKKWDFGVFLFVIVSFGVTFGLMQLYRAMGLHIHWEAKRTVDY